MLKSFNSTIVFIETFHNFRYEEVQNIVNFSYYGSKTFFFFKNFSQYTNRNDLNEKRSIVKGHTIELKKITNTDIELEYNEDDSIICRSAKLESKGIRPLIYFFWNMLFCISIRKEGDKIRNNYIKKPHKYEIYSVDLNFFPLNRNLYIFLCVEKESKVIKYSTDTYSYCDNEAPSMSLELEFLKEDFIKVLLKLLYLGTEGHTLLIVKRFLFYNVDVKVNKHTCKVNEMPNVYISNLKYSSFEEYNSIKKELNLSLISILEKYKEHLNISMKNIFKLEEQFQNPFPIIGYDYMNIRYIHDFRLLNSIFNTHSKRLSDICIFKEQKEYLVPYHCLFWISNKNNTNCAIFTMQMKFDTLDTIKLEIVWSTIKKCEIIQKMEEEICKEPFIIYIK